MFVFVENVSTTVIVVAIDTAPVFRWITFSRELLYYSLRGIKKILMLYRNLYHFPQLQRNIFSILKHNWSRNDCTEKIRGKLFLHVQFFVLVFPVIFICSVPSFVLRSILCFIQIGNCN